MDAGKATMGTLQFSLPLDGRGKAIASLAGHGDAPSLMNAETGTQIGPSLTFTSGQRLLPPTAGSSSCRVRKSAEYLSSSNTWQYISLSSSIGDIGLNSAVLGADGCGASAAAIQTETRTSRHARGAARTP
jgi:hypothetical protein